MSGSLDPAQASYTALLQSIPPFLGREGEDVYRWVLRLERLAAALHIEEQVVLAVALASLDEGAYDWSEAFGFDSFATFKHALLQRYSEDHQVIRHNLLQCKQDPHEAIQSYADRFRKLAARARCTEGGEVLSRFLSGLAPDMYDRVLGCRPNTFDEALQHCLYFERMLRIRRPEAQQRPTEADRNRYRPSHSRWWPNQPPPARSAPAPPTRGPSAPVHPDPSRGEAIKSLTRDMGRLQINTAKPAPACYACGQFGHIAARCPNKPPLDAPFYPNPRMMVRMVPARGPEDWWDSEEWATESDDANEAWHDTLPPYTWTFHTQEQEEGEAPPTPPKEGLSTKPTPPCLPSTQPNPYVKPPSLPTAMPLSGAPAASGKERHHVL